MRKRCSLTRRLYICAATHRRKAGKLEKCQLMIEQQAKEIGYLKEMIALLQKQA